MSWLRKLQESYKLIEGRLPILVSVDIQPEYYYKSVKYGGFRDDLLNKFIKELRSSFKYSKRILFYNGADTLGMISEDEYKGWLYEKGIDEDMIDSIVFYDKGYAFFRYCIDEGVDEDVIVNLVKYMISKNVFDTRELDKEFWDEYVETYGDKNIREMLEFTRNSINIPELMDELQDYYNIILCGGGVTECLKEVEIALKALDKTYTLLTKYTY
jgi:hypothetical protein